MERNWLYIRHIIAVLSSFGILIFSFLLVLKASALSTKHFSGQLRPSDRELGQAANLHGRNPLFPAYVSFRWDRLGISSLQR